MAAQPREIRISPRTAYLLGRATPDYEYCHGNRELSWLYSRLYPLSRTPARHHDELYVWGDFHRTLLFVTNLGARASVCGKRLLII